MGREYKQNDLYVVELDEEEWYFNGADHDDLTDSYRTAARAHSCSRVAVFVTPDALFSMCGHDKRHRVYEHSFPAADAPFKVSAEFRGAIDSEVYNRLDDRGKRKLINTVRDELNEYARGVAGRYTIVLLPEHPLVVLERGRV